MKEKKEKKFVKPWVADKIMQAGLCDERGIIFRSAFQVAAAISKKEIAGNIAKNVATVFLLGYYEQSASDFVGTYLALKGNDLHIVPQSKVKKKTTTEDITANTMILNQEVVQEVRTVKKSLGMTYLYLTVGTNDFIVVFCKKETIYLAEVLKVFESLVNA